MKRISWFLLSTIFLVFCSCNGDEPKEDENPSQPDVPENPEIPEESDEPDMVDYSPIQLQVVVENKEGENLLEPDVTGNILDSDMYIIFEEEKFDVTMGRPMEPYFPYPGTRDYMPKWYGAFISPYFFMSAPLPLQTNRINIGQFDGLLPEATVELFILDNKYEVSFTNKYINCNEFDRHFYLDGVETEEPYIYRIIL